jgi:hypothetical protein
MPFTRPQSPLRKHGQCIGQEAPSQLQALDRVRAVLVQIALVVRGQPLILQTLEVAPGSLR